MPAWLMIALGALPALISLAEGLFGHGKGEEKKQTVTGIVTSVLSLLTTASTGQQAAFWKALAPLIPPIVDALASAPFPKGTTVEKGEAVRMAATFMPGDFSDLERGSALIDTTTQPTA